MDRRKFLVGLGSASVGGSALLGSGAFSRVESHRAVTIAVAEDPDAYLGLDKCPGSANGSYAWLDDDGHLAIEMNEENPTHNGEVDDYLGAGINSNSTSWFDRVFQVCNQGKEPACVWISDDDQWPHVPAGEPHEGDRRVEFYLEDDDESSIIGRENSFVLDVGECVCVGIRTRSYGLSDGDELLGDLDNTIEINADVDGECFVPGESTCQIWGIERESANPGLRPVSVVDDGTVDGVGSAITALPDSAGERNYPNGLAFDAAQGRYYFATTVGSEKGVLHSFDVNNGVTEYDPIGGGNDIAGAVFHDGKYYYVPNGTKELKTAVVDTYGDSSSSVTIEDVATFENNLGFGDIAVDQSANDLYFSTVNGYFFSYDLDSDTENDIGGDAAGKQIAFAHGILWAHDANSGEWFTVDTSDGSTTLVGETRTFTDLAKCGDLDQREPRR